MYVDTLKLHRCRRGIFANPAKIQYVVWEIVMDQALGYLLICQLTWSILLKDVVVMTCEVMARVL